VGRPPIKSTRELTKTRIKAELQAAAEWGRTETGISATMLEHLGTAIDRIDPIELAAIGATTVVVYDMIKASDDLANALKNAFEKSNPYPNPTQVVTDFLKQPVTPTGSNPYTWAVAQPGFDLLWGNLANWIKSVIK
jgi:hypothetical protein